MKVFFFLLKDNVLSLKCSPSLHVHKYNNYCTHSGFFHSSCSLVVVASWSSLLACSGLIIPGSPILSRLRLKTHHTSKSRFFHTNVWETDQTYESRFYHTWVWRTHHTCELRFYHNYAWSTCHKCESRLVKPVCEGVIMHLWVIIPRCEGQKIIPTRFLCFEFE